MKVIIHSEIGGEPLKSASMRHHESTQLTSHSQIKINCQLKFIATTRIIIIIDEDNKTYCEIANGY